MNNVRTGPIAVIECPNCEVSDTADVFFVKDHAGLLVGVVFRCVVCAAVGWQPG